MIPKIINFVWIGGAARPDWALRNLQEFQRLNPGYEIKIHDEGALLDELRPAYARCNELVTKSDLIRYSVLETVGGWYFDFDFYPMRPLADAESAFGLDGRRLLVARQHGQRDPKLEYANAPLAAAPGTTAIRTICQRIAAHTGPVSRVAFGPALIRDLVRERPDLFAVADWPWWFPAGRELAVGYYLGALDGQREVLRVLNLETGGQFPFAIHLWAGGRLELRIGGPPPLAVAGKLDGKAAGMIANPAQWADTTQCFQSVVRGLGNLGYRVEVRQPEYGWPLFSRFPSLAVCWNGRRPPVKGWIERARAAGSIVLVMEHGFWERRLTTQLDAEGILHWASWRRVLKSPSPVGARERLARFYPRGLVAPRVLKGGYVLVLGQVLRDTQMEDSEIQSPLELERIIARAVSGVKGVFFRPHPACLLAERHQKRQYLPRLPETVVGSTNYYRTHQEAPRSELAEAINGARFVVTINSNTINECLALGCPVLAFGPSLALDAGVVRRATVATIKDDLRGMEGWLPDVKQVENYLSHLADRQYTQNELETGLPLKRALLEAGVPI